MLAILRMSLSQLRVADYQLAVAGPVAETGRRGTPDFDQPMSVKRCRKQLVWLGGSAGSA